MYSRAPRLLPSFAVMLDDLGQPRARKLAKHLGVCLRTVQRWKAEDHAPRAVMLAMFWETSWGQAIINSQAEHDARVFAGYAKCLSAERGLPIPPMHREAANSGRWASIRPRLVGR